MDTLGSSLFGKSREAVIGLLFGQEGIALHGREIARRARLSAQTVQVELRNLEQAGVLRAQNVGNVMLYSANPEFPLFDELRAIAVKTWGMRGRLRAALDKVEGIDLAFIFGSYAKGTAHSKSDIDVLVIGNADYSELTAATESASMELGRRVDAQLYRAPEWRRKLAEGNTFLRAIAEEPKVFLKGDKETLNAASGLEKALGARQGRGDRAQPGRDKAQHGAGPRVSRHRRAKGHP